MAPTVYQESQVTVSAIVSNGETSEVVRHTVTVKPVQTVTVNEPVSKSSGGLPLTLISLLTVMAMARRRYQR